MNVNKDFNIGDELVILNKSTGKNNKFTLIGKQETSLENSCGLFVQLKEPLFVESLQQYTFHFEYVNPPISFDKEL